MAYAAPNEDTVVVVGGLGTQVDANEFNGGGATKAVWDAGSPSDFIGANGGTITQDLGGATYDHTGGAAERMVSSAGIGTGVTVGTLAYLSGTNISAGVYEITSIAGDDSWVAFANIDATGDNADTHIRVGGALDTLQQGLDNAVNDATSYNRYIYDNIATETITTTINADTRTGSASTRTFVFGYNSTLTAEAEIIITTATDLGAGALLAFSTSDYFTFHNIDFNAGGKDSNLGGYCVYSAGSGDGTKTVFKDCKFRGAETDGVYLQANYCSFFNCEMNLNGRYGYCGGTGANYNTKLAGCKIHDNDNHGICFRPAENILIGNLIYDNGKDGTGTGIHWSSNGSRNFLISNTIHGNATDGISLNIDETGIVLFNNTAVNNGAYGYDFQGTVVGDFEFFGYNHSYNNTTAHYSGGIDATFAAFGNGNNQTGDPKFTSVVDGSEDFTPTTGSDLIDNGLAAAGTNTDIGAIQQAAGAGSASGVRNPLGGPL